jgi:hypothetical protein
MFGCRYPCYCRDTCLMLLFFWLRLAGHLWLQVLLHISVNIFLVYDGIYKSFRTESIMKYTLTFGITRWEATRRVMAANLTRLTHEIAIQLHLVAGSCTMCGSRSRRPVRKLLDTPSYTLNALRSRYETWWMGRHFGRSTCLRMSCSRA